MEPSRRDLIGSVVGHYELLQRLGPEGATGIVYRGRHLTMKSPAAVKVLAGSGKVDKRKINRFTREAQIHASLDHPTIVPIYDHGFDSTNEIFYIATKLVEGTSLANVLDNRQGPLSFEEALMIANQVGSALAYAHDPPKKVLHLDLKPSNILVGCQAADSLIGKKAYLIDFGFSLSLRDAMKPRHHFYGTYSYWAPEQALSRRLDQRTDLYSLGVIFYEMLTGRVPYEHSDPTEVIRDIVTAPPPALSQFNQLLGPQSDSFFLKALAKKRTDRFKDVREMLISFEKLGNEVEIITGDLLDEVISETCGQESVDVPLQRFVKEVAMEKQFRLAKRYLELAQRPSFGDISPFIEFVHNLLYYLAREKALELTPQSPYFNQNLFNEMRVTAQEILALDDRKIRSNKEELILAAASFCLGRMPPLISRTETARWLERYVHDKDVGIKVINIQQELDRQ